MQWRPCRFTLLDRQAMALLDKEKSAYRGFKEHLNYLLQVNEGCSGHFTRNVLKSIVHWSGAHLKLMHDISSMYDEVAPIISSMRTNW
jgi:hypothetical protein